MNEVELKIVEEAIEILDRELVKPEVFITDPQSVRKFLVLKLAQLEHEVFAVMFLNNQHGLIEYNEMFRGTIDGASVHPREVAKLALKLNAAAVVFAHNHPSAVAEPSQADIRITERLRTALSLFDIRVLDHMIVGGKQVHSFAEAGLL